MKLNRLDVEMGGNMNILVIILGILTFFILLRCVYNAGYLDGLRWARNKIAEAFPSDKK